MSRSSGVALISSVWWKLLFLSALAVLLSSVPRAHSQAVSAKTSSPTIVSNVDEVSLDVVVRDKKKKPVADLKPDDLAITDNGTPVKISDLRLITRGSGSDQLVTLIFDRMDSSVAQNARELAGKILKEVPASGFSLSVLSIEGRLKLYQDFTSDRAQITQSIRAAVEAPRNQKSTEAEAAEKKLLALARTGVDESGVRVKSEQRNVAQVLLASLQDSQRIIQEQHTNATLASLLALARAERKIPGRKVVIYFSQGTIGTDSDEMLGAIVGAANRSGVSFYTIDANVFNEQAAQGLLATMALGNSVSMGQSRVSAPQALTGPPPTPFGDLTTPGMKSMISSQVDRFQTREGHGDQGPLSELAQKTDGGFAPAGENPRKMVRNMLQDLSSYYEISYVPPIKEYNGQFRAVAIKPFRKGMKAHSRAGYFAVPSQNDTGFKLFEAPLLKVFTEPQLPSDIKVQARILQLGDVGSGDASALLVEVPISELMTKDDPNTNLYSFHASMVAQVKNKSGEIIEHFSEDSPKHGALDSKDSARDMTVAMQRHFMADPGEYTIEAAVLDRNSGKVGAIRSPFVIAQTSAGSSLSDLALVQRLDPFPDEVDPAEPLRFGDRKVIPTVMDRMNRGVKQIQLFSVVHSDPRSDQQPRLELTVMRNREAIAQVPLQLRAATGAAAIPYVASIQSGSLPPGSYQLIESLTQGEKTSEKSLTFRIDGPELASATTPADDHSAAPSADELGMLATSKLQTDGAHQLVITSLPEGSAPKPSAEELQAIIEAARKHSVGYAKSLPNFVCVETTNRSVDTSGNGAWKRRDTMAELLRFVDNVETRTMVERNGARTSLQRTDLDPTWATSVGEFGHLLNLVFSPESKTEFQWKEAAALGSTTVQVLGYRVSSKNATMALNDDNRRIGVGFHGLVYVDGATGGVRRITMEADDVPRDFSIHAASMSVDYDYVTISAHDYLMPMRAVLALRRGHKQTDLNEMAFRGYRRYSSQAKIIVNP